MMEAMIGILLALAIGAYAWLALGRTKAKQFSVIRTLAALLFGLSVLDIWSTTAMVVLHLAAYFLLFDFISLFIKAEAWKAIHKSCLLPIILCLLVLYYGGLNMDLVYKTGYTVHTEKTIRTEGYRILYLSDLHYGTVQDPAVLEEKIDEMNAQEPDLVILGGDIVEEGTTMEEMQAVFSLLGQLQSTYGTYFVYGNHDTLTFTKAELEAAMTENGITILEDSTLEIGEDILLAGRADAAWDGSAGRQPIATLLETADQSKYIITLDHQPLEAEENAAAGVDLLLSGHTHAGQLFPVGYLNEWIGNLNYGLYEADGCTAIVSSGFAGWGYDVRTQGHCEYVIINILP